MLRRPQLNLNLNLEKPASNLLVERALFMSDLMITQNFEIRIYFIFNLPSFANVRSQMSHCEKIEINQHNSFYKFFTGFSSDQ
jgi:hypothetical protein